MAEAGVRLFHDITAFAAVGGTEALSRLPLLFKAFRICSVRLSQDRPRALVLVDFPEFNMRLGRVAHRLGIPAIYFVPPQIWAWRRWRVRVLRRFVRMVLSVFPFEAEFFRRAGVPVEFIGHPLLDHLPELTREEARASLGIAPEETLIGLLPGSRREEVARLLPIMLEASAQVVRNRPIRVLVALAPTVTRDEVRAMIEGGSFPATLVEGQTYRVMAAADCALVASGTATLETACFGTPMIVCYKTSRLTYLIARLTVRIPWISLANIVAGRQIVPELIQGDLTSTRLASHALAILDDPSVAKAQRDGLSLVREKLGAAGASERAARFILEISGHPGFVRRGT
jgi:lipid-A-disaccharide synthase